MPFVPTILNYTRTAVIALFFCIKASLATATPIVSIQYDAYPVTGENIQHIRETIAQNGPKDEQGATYAAHTAYNIAWHFTYNQKPESCSIAAVQSEITITYRMPVLAASSHMDNKTATQWKQYFTALSTHEEGHASFGLQAAEKIEQSILALSSSRTCSELEKRANDTAHAIVETYDEKNLDYDRITNHGATQGASLAGL